MFRGEGGREGRFAPLFYSYLLALFTTPAARLRGGGREGGAGLGGWGEFSSCASLFEGAEGSVGRPGREEDGGREGRPRRTNERTKLPLSLSLCPRPASQPYVVHEGAHRRCRFRVWVGFVVVLSVCPWLGEEVGRETRGGENGFLIEIIEGKQGGGQRKTNL